MFLTENTSFSSYTPRTKPAGTRRRQLEWFTNFVLVVVSLFGCSIGAGLLGFYHLHLLSFVSLEFFIVPLVLLGGGALTLVVSLIGLFAISQRSVCLLWFYAFALFVALIVLLGGVACSVKVIFTIHVGIDHSLALPVIKKYGEDPIATLTWDKLQRTYRCCGAETTFDLGYMSWQGNKVLDQTKSVPDSCCIRPFKDCGKDIFDQHNLKKMSDYVKKIHVHGCLQVMETTLKEHVVLILTVFAITGSALSLLEVLGIVAACCLANLLLEERKKKSSSNHNAPIAKPEFD